MENSLPLWNRKQVAHALGYAGTKSIARLVERGELPEMRLTSQALRYRPEDVEAYLEKKQKKVKREPFKPRIY